MSRFYELLDSLDEELMPSVMRRDLEDAHKCNPIFTMQYLLDYIDAKPSVQEEVRDFHLSDGDRITKELKLRESENVPTTQDLTEWYNES